VDVLEFAETAPVEELDAGGEARLGAILGADLDDAVVFRGGCDHLAAFPDRVAHRFFDVDVFASLTGPNGEERVPMVGGDDEDGVDVGRGLRACGRRWW